MTRKQAKELLPAIQHFAEGGNLWYYSKDMNRWFPYDMNEELYFTSTNGISYIIEDKHFEARKHFALGGEIEVVIHKDSDWEDIDNPTFDNNFVYRPKPEEPVYECKCGETNQDNFHKGSNQCKECKRSYRLSKSGIITQLYANQKVDSKRRGHPMPEYSKEELVEYLEDNDVFNILYENYKANDFNRNLLPGFDRIDDNLGYSFDNVRITTLRENIDKEYKKGREGTSVRKNYTPISQYNLDGTFIESFVSQNEASRRTGIGLMTINKCVNGKQASTCGYVFKFEPSKRIRQ